jgi:hypothetical protein
MMSNCVGLQAQDTAAPLWINHDGQSSRSSGAVLRTCAELAVVRLQALDDPADAKLVVALHTWID